MWGAARGVWVAHLLYLGAVRLHHLREQRRVCAADRGGGQRCEQGWRRCKQSVIAGACVRALVNSGLVPWHFWGRGGRL